MYDDNTPVVTISAAAIMNFFMILRFNIFYSLIFSCLNYLCLSMSALFRSVKMYTSSYCNNFVTIFDLMDKCRLQTNAAA